MTVMMSFACLCVLLLVGNWLRLHVKVLRTLYLPSCVIAGLIGLVVLQVAPRVGLSIPASFTAGWGSLPGLLINVVFACLFLGVHIPKLRTVWNRSAPQLGYGQIVAWGQYVVGIGLTMFVIKLFWTDVPDMFAGILPVGFEGGHGTAGGMGPVFEKLNWEAGKHLALGSATAGIVSAIVVGMVLVNWAVRKGYTVRKVDPDTVTEDDSIGIIDPERRPSAGRLTVSSDVVETFTVNLAVVGVAILIGVLVKQGLVLLESQVAFLRDNNLLSSFPLFPLCMLGGLVVQLVMKAPGQGGLIDAGLMKRIQNSALDFLVVAAIATIQISVFAELWLPFTILVIAGILWNVFCVTVLARRLLPNAWFERAIAEMGQSMGVTATGLLLLRVVDPEYESPAADAFAYKQLLHEPFMGGGLWTGMAIPLLATLGGLKVFGIACAAMLFWVVFFVLARKSFAERS